MQLQPLWRIAAFATTSAARCTPRPICRARWLGSQSGAVVRAISPVFAMPFSALIRRWRIWRGWSSPRRRLQRRWWRCAARRGNSAAEFERALAKQLPLLKRDGGFVREGYEPSLDESRNLRDASRLVVASMQARYADDAGVKGLRSATTMCSAISSKSQPSTATS